MFESLPNEVGNIPIIDYSRNFNYRQPIPWAQILAPAIQSITKSVTDSLDPAERSRRRLADLETTYRTTLLTRQMANLSGGGGGVDSAGYPLNPDGTPMTPQQRLQYDQAKANLERTKTLNEKAKASGGSPEPFQIELPTDHASNEALPEGWHPPMAMPDLQQTAAAPSNAQNSAFPRLIDQTRFPTTEPDVYWEGLPA